MGGGAYTRLVIYHFALFRGEKGGRGRAITSWSVFVGEILVRAGVQMHAIALRQFFWRVDDAHGVPSIGLVQSEVVTGAGRYCGA